MALARAGAIFVSEVAMADRPKRRRGRRWDMTRALAFKRDKSVAAPCWICGAAIDYSLAPSSCSDAWEPDHYIPVDDHPELEYDLGNIRPSHAGCNRSRQKRAGTNPLGTPSRDWRRRQG